MVFYEKITDKERAKEIASLEEMSARIAARGQLSFSHSYSNMPRRDKLISSWEAKIVEEGSLVLAATFLDEIVAVAVAEAGYSSGGEIVKIIGAKDDDIIRNLVKRLELFLIGKGKASVTVRVFKSDLFSDLGYVQKSTVKPNYNSPFDQDLIVLEKKLVSSIIF